MSKGKNKIGSTLKGIGPTYMDKTGRNGLRVGDILSPNFENKYKTLVAKHINILKHYEDFKYELKELEANWFEGIETMKKLQFVDSENYINKALSEGKKILAEGAQGTMLDTILEPIHLSPLRTPLQQAHAQDLCLLTKSEMSLVSSKPIVPCRSGPFLLNCMIMMVN